MAMQDSGIQDHQFQRLLQIFPIVRTRDYCEDDIAISSSKAPIQSADHREVAGRFWTRLKSSVEPKLGQEGAERFCEAFRRVHRDVVLEKLPRESIERIARSLKSRTHL